MKRIFSRLIVASTALFVAFGCNNVEEFVMPDVDSSLTGHDYCVPDAKTKVTIDDCYNAGSLRSQGDKTNKFALGGILGRQVDDKDKYNYRAMTITNCVNYGELATRMVTSKLNDAIVGFYCFGDEAGAYVTTVDCYAINKERSSENTIANSMNGNTNSYSDFYVNYQSFNEVTAYNPDLDYAGGVIYEDYKTPYEPTAQNVDVSSLANMPTLSGDVWDIVDACPQLKWESEVE